MCQTNSSLPLPHTSWPWTPPSHCLLRCAFLSITLSCVGAGSPSLGGAGGSGPPWLLTLSPFLLLWIPAAARWQRLLGLHCYGGGDVGVWGRPSTEGDPWGGVMVPVYAGAWGTGGGTLPCPALLAAGWLFGRGGTVQCVGSERCLRVGGVTPVQPLGSPWGFDPHPAGCSPPAGCALCCE